MTSFVTNQSPASSEPTFVTPRSQGYTAGSEVFGQAVKGLSAIATDAVNAVDSVNTRAIAGEAKTGIDATFNDMGFRTKSNDTTGTPTELKDYASQLEVTKKAYLSGSISQSNLDIRVDALARQMRLNHPGYGDVIDKLVGQTLNRSTANNVWQSLSQEWNKQQTSAQAEANKKDTMIKEFAANGLLMQAFPTFAALQAAGKEPSADEIIAKVGVIAASNATLDSNKKYNDYLKSSGEADQQHTYDTAKASAMQVSRVFMQAGSQGGELFKRLSLEDPMKMSDREIMETNAALQPLILKAQADIHERLSDPSFDNLTLQQAKDVEERAMSPIYAMQDAIKNRDTTFFTLQGNLNKAGSDKITAGLLNGDAGDVFKVFDTTKTLLGPLAAEQFLGENSNRAPSNKAQTNAQLLTSKISTMLLVTEKKPLAQVIDESKKATSENKIDASVVQKTITNSVDIVMSSDAKPEGRLQVAKNLFSDGNAGFLGKFSSSVGVSGQSDRMVVFQKLTSPAMSKSVAELAKTDPGILRDYTNTLYRGFKELFGAKIDNAASANLNGSIAGFKFNPETFQVDVQRNQDPTSVAQHGALASMPFGIGAIDAAQQAWDTYHASSAGQDIKQVNAYLRNFKEAMVTAGIDPKIAVTELLQNTGALDGGHPPTSLFSMLSKAVVEGVGNMNSAGASGQGGSAYPKAGAAEAQKKQALDDQMKTLFGDGHANGLEGDQHQKLRDFIGQAEGADYNTLQGGVKAPLTAMTFGQVAAMADHNVSENGAKSTAVGKYQLTSETMQRAMKALGLTSKDTFSAENQDRIANYLITKEAGGGKDPAKLAGIWASLPKDATGAGAYDGFNGNKSQVTYEKLLSVLGN
jgi:hypothetical protein